MSAKERTIASDSHSMVHRLLVLSIVFLPWSVLVIPDVGSNKKSPCVNSGMLTPLSTTYQAEAASIDIFI